MKYSGITIMIDGVKCIQVNKTKARRAYNSGKNVYLHPCNMKINSVWGRPIKINNTYGNNFDYSVNSFKYYNCVHGLGNYPNYFVEA